MIWIAILLALLCSFVFSGIEAGILSVSRVRLRHRIDAGDAAAARLESLLHDPARLLMTVLIVTNLTNVSAFILGTGEIVSRLGLPGYAVSLAIALPLYLLALEMLPKSIFRRFPYRALAALSEPLRLADIILSPFVGAGRELSRLLLRRNSAQREGILIRDDFKFLTLESERIGNLTKIQREIIHNLVDFQLLTAKELMQPISPGRILSASASIEKAIRQARESGFERLPVAADGGKVVGMVRPFEILMERPTTKSLASFTQRILAVGVDESAQAILGKMRALRAEMALVVTNEAMPTGVISMNDIARRLASAR